MEKSWKNELVEMLSSEFTRIKEINPRFSLRAFAKKLEVSPTILSQMLRSTQKWNLSKERVADILSRIESPKKKKDYLLNLLGLPVSRERKIMDESKYKILTHWTYLAILCCHELPPEERKTELIAKRLGLTKETVQEKIEELIESGFLCYSLNGSYIESNPNFWSAGDGPPNPWIQKHHKENLTLAIQAIESTPIEKRDFSSMMFLINPLKVAEIRKEIRDFYEKIMSLSNKHASEDEVYQFCISLFPMKNREQEYMQ